MRRSQRRRTGRCFTWNGRRFVGPSGLGCAAPRGSRRELRAPRTRSFAPGGRRPDLRPDPDGALPRPYGDVTQTTEMPVIGRPSRAGAAARLTRNPPVPRQPSESAGCEPTDSHITHTHAARARSATHDKAGPVSLRDHAARPPPGGRQCWSQPVRAPPHRCRITTGPPHRQAARPRPGEAYEFRSACTSWYWSARARANDRT